MATRLSDGSHPVPDALARLALPATTAFLSPRHVQAGTSLAMLFERARLRQRVTMSYDASRIGSAGNVQSNLADSAADARQKLAAIARKLPQDCWGVLIDVCLYEKGLQDIELERRWPRRAAKLVLRIGLDHVAQLLGVEDVATGPERGRSRNWLPERPRMFPEDDEINDVHNRNDPQDRGGVMRTP